MGNDRATRPDAVQSITSARDALSDDIARRSTRYLWQMSTRVVCFVGAVLVDHWTRWLLVAGAVVLPYVAVVLANAGQERREGALSPVGPAELPAGRTTAAPLGAADASTDAHDETEERT